MKELVERVEKLAEGELNRCIEKHGLFNSTHEGYAVMLEEVDEAQDEVERVGATTGILWKRVKTDDTCSMLHHAKYIKEHATLLAAEAIQVAAMAEKFIKSMEVEK